MLKKLIKQLYKHFEGKNLVGEHVFTGFVTRS